MKKIPTRFISAVMALAVFFASAVNIPQTVWADEIYTNEATVSGSAINNSAGAMMAFEGEEPSGEFCFVVEQTAKQNALQKNGIIFYADNLIFNNEYADITAQETFKYRFGSSDIYFDGSGNTYNGWMVMQTPTAATLTVNGTAKSNMYTAFTLTAMQDCQIKIDAILSGSNKTALLAKAIDGDTTVLQTLEMLQTNSNGIIPGGASGMHTFTATLSAGETAVFAADVNLPVFAIDIGSVQYIETTTETTTEETTEATTSAEVYVDRNIYTGDVYYIEDYMNANGLTQLSSLGDTEICDGFYVVHNGAGSGYPLENRYKYSLANVSDDTTSKKWLNIGTAYLDLEDVEIGSSILQYPPTIEKGVAFNITEPCTAVLLAGSHKKLETQAMYLLKVDEEETGFDLVDKVYTATDSINEITNTRNVACAVFNFPTPGKYYVASFGSFDLLGVIMNAEISTENIPADTMYITADTAADTQASKIGSTVDINFELHNNQGFQSYTLYLDYDPSVIVAEEFLTPDNADLAQYCTYTLNGGTYPAFNTDNGNYAVTNVPEATDTAFAANDADGVKTQAELGRVKLAWSTPGEYVDKDGYIKEVTTNGRLFTVRFKVIGKGNAKIKVNGAFNPSPANAVTGKIINYKPYTNSMKFALKELPNYLQGDVNADGILSADDADILAKKAMSSSFTMPLESKTDKWIYVADIDKDGSITANDAAMVYQKTLADDYDYENITKTENIPRNDFALSIGQPDLDYTFIIPNMEKPKQRLNFYVKNNSGFNNFTLFIKYDPSMLKAADGKWGDLVTNGNNSIFAEQISSVPAADDPDFAQSGADGVKTCGELGLIKLAYFNKNADSFGQLKTIKGDGLLFSLDMELLQEVNRKTNAGISVTVVGNGFVYDLGYGVDFITYMPAKIYNNNNGVYLMPPIQFGGASTDIIKVLDEATGRYVDKIDEKPISANDSSIILQKVLNGSYRMPIENIVDDYEPYIDVDLSGTIDAADAAMVLQKVLNNSYMMLIELR